jgi:hypothetical protein
MKLMLIGEIADNKVIGFVPKTYFLYEYDLIWT